MTAEETVRGWIERRTPPVPEKFRRWVTPATPDVKMSVSALVGEARRSLDRGRDLDPRAREGAFDLLAADGFVTWACEAALDARDPVASLAGIVEALLE